MFVEDFIKLSAAVHDVFT